MCGNKACLSEEICNDDEIDPMCVPCGHKDGPCCDIFWCSDEKLYCDLERSPAGISLNGTCVKCGIAGNQCCDGDECVDGNICFEGMCVPCGHQNGPCCDDWRRPCSDDDEDLYCHLERSPTDPYLDLNGSCAKCGMTGNQCCKGDHCMNGNVCFNGICEECFKGPDSPCCNHGDCGSINLFCDYAGDVGDPGMCQSCGGANQTCCEDGACTLDLQCIKRPGSALPSCVGPGDYEGLLCGKDADCPLYHSCVLNENGVALCMPCGKKGSICCEDSYCEHGSTCDFSGDGMPTCVECGFLDQRCCYMQEQRVLGCAAGLVCDQLMTPPGEPRCVSNMVGTKEP